MVYILPVLSVLLGYVLVRFLLKSEKLISYLLSFSGAFLLSITLFEMLPELFSTPQKILGVFIMGGILLQIILDFFSKGAEHGHVHLHNDDKGFPWLLFVSLSVHAMIEGAPAAENNHVLWGVVIHKLPIAIILSLFFVKSGIRPTHSFLFLLLFALMTPLGSYLMDTFSFLQENKVFINAVAIGIFLHVSTTILFESSRDHKFNLTKLVVILLGTLIAYVI